MIPTGADLPGTSPRHASLPAAAPLPRDALRARRLAAPRTIMALILREMSTRYGRSPGGYVWAILDPLGTILLLSAAFEIMMGAPVLGTSFILFKATGMMPFTLYGNVWTSVSHAIQFSKPLLMYPGVTWIDAILARLILNVLTTLLVTYLIFAGILWYIGTGQVLDMAPIALSLGLAALIGLGLGCVNCYLFMVYPAWEHTWNILNRPMFLASGILFLYESLPEALQAILWYNPLVHVTALMRAGFYPTYNPVFVSVPYVLACALVPMVIGLLLLRRHHVDLLNI